MDEESWLKKNPWLSMWLSAVNSTTGAARGRETAEANRQAAAMMAEATGQVLRFWTGGLAPPRPRKRKKSR